MPTRQLAVGRDLPYHAAEGWEVRVSERDTAGGQNDFGAWLTEIMRERGLSQADLARRLDIDAAQLSRWRRGLVTPSVNHLQRIAAVLAVPREDLDRLAGYPVAGTGIPLPGADDPARAIEREAYEAWFGRVLDRKVPPLLWRSYAGACAALADALIDGFDAALTQARGGRE